MKTKVPLEIEEQILVIEYLEFLKLKGDVVMFSAVPNNTFTRSWSQKNKMKREGVRKGVPDIIVVTKNKVLFIEMKRIKGGVIGKEQKEWNKAINDAGGNAVICKGFDEARKYLDENII